MVRLTAVFASAFFVLALGFGPSAGRAWTSEKAKTGKVLLEVDGIV